jgi:polysaccharide pyruvyl transferase WcaK-like protein/glycosyltransferase involved in cell wall biosynthesis
VSRSPRVTIAIPVYNGEQFLQETIDSIVAQTFTDYEVIISDNASTDRTAEICREYAARDSRVRYVRQERNVGLARNYEHLVRLAGGEYFKLANADDLCDPRLVERCVEVLDAHPEAVLCYGKTVLIDAKGEVIRYHEDNLDLRQPRAADRFRLALQRLQLVNVLEGVIRTASLRRTGLLGTYVAADMALVPELTLHGQFHELPEFLFFRRMHAGASSSIVTDEEDLKFWDPLARREKPPVVAQRLWSYATGIWRAPIPAGQKLELLGGVMRRVITRRRDLLQELRYAWTPARAARPPLIGVLGHYGNANLGDEAIIHAVMTEVRRRRGNLLAVSNNPADTAWRHDVPAVSLHSGERREAGHGAAHVPAPDDPVPARPARRAGVLRAARRAAGRVVRGLGGVGAEVASSWRILRHLRRVDLLLVAGSNQMLDNFGGPWEFPYINLKWSILARMAGCRVAWISVGAGPLDSRLSRRFVRASLRLADYVSVRDEGSLRLLRDIGVKREILVFPDLAHGLAHDQGALAPRERDGGRPTIGINPMPMYDGRYWPEAAPEKNRRFVSELAALAAGAIKEGHDVFFFATHPRDARVARDILALMEAEHGQRPGGADLVRSSATTEALLRDIASADLVVTTRFHGALLSLLVGRPTLAISYYRKTQELMADLGHGDDLAIPLDDLRAADALERLRLLEDRAEKLVPAMRQKSAEYRAALREQYDRVFKLVAGR